MHGEPLKETVIVVETATTGDATHGRLACPKPRPRLLDKRERARELDKIDREQKAMCRSRSGGRCEVIVTRGRVLQLCQRHATQNHHLIFGLGRRNRGKSLFARHRLDTCKKCHDEITGHVLIPCVEQALAECAATVRYERRT